MDFSGSYEEFKEKLSSLGGVWDDSKNDRKVYRLDGGVLNWHESTGNISFQGKAKGKAFLEEEVPKLVSRKASQKTMTANLLDQSQSEITKRIKGLVDAVCDGMFEREEIISVALLGALCGQNTFLYGPPGTAKSLISRRIACAFSQPTYFEYLMNRFSTPEDVFGPVSIKALKEDLYTRKTQNYLPMAEFAFLDEIWKSSPAILNTLLTLINEHIFRNGEKVEKAPLKALIAASNETPEANQGLEALYDRFIIRLMVGPIEQSKNFNQLLSSKPTDAQVKISDDLIVQTDEWSQWRSEIHNVALSKEVLTIVHLIREALTSRFDELNVYVSDRRWQRAAMLMKASAFFNGRTQTNHSDALLLEHCLWTKEDNRLEVKEIVQKAVKETGFDSGISLAEIDLQKEQLDKEINSELFYSSDVYDVENIDGKPFFKVRFESNSHYNSSAKIIYIALSNLKTKKEFHPVDQRGNEFDEITCSFDGQGTCILKERYSYSNYSQKFQPKVLFHKGDKKEKVNTRLVDSLALSVSDIRNSLSAILNTVEEQRERFEFDLKSIFVSEEKTNIAISGVVEQIESLRLRIKDCERLEYLCK
ncbi:AAA family ATPase [Marinomonas communis]|uniref:MoxR-like ATPase n=1 Tax=Marinomonas communis TaxID=28254 RepID=A0A4R6X0M3_9GAMM|nr:AAA family ATPase [Marinomonas communis]TDR05898.1 MoxR-like ATPase [Marinomonas communis]